MNFEDIATTAFPKTVPLERAARDQLLLTTLGGEKHLVDFSVAVEELLSRPAGGRSDEADASLARSEYLYLSALCLRPHRLKEALQEVPGIAASCGSPRFENTLACRGNEISTSLLGGFDLAETQSHPSPAASAFWLSRPIWWQRGDGFRYKLWANLFAAASADENNFNNARALAASQVGLFHPTKDWMLDDNLALTTRFDDNLPFRVSVHWWVAHQRPTQSALSDLKKSLNAADAEDSLLAGDRVFVVLEKPAWLWAQESQEAIERKIDEIQRHEAKAGITGASCASLLSLHLSLAKKQGEQSKAVDLLRAGTAVFSRKETPYLTSECKSEFLKRCAETEESYRDAQNALAYICKNTEDEMAYIFS